jgi:xylan 1,4-beta-xylosidase
VTIGSLNATQKYYFSIDAFNENGISKSKKIIELD